MFRKTVLTSAIIGAGLVSTAGAAFAGDAPSSSEGHHHSGHSKHHESNSTCVNNAGGSVDNGGAEAFGGVNGSQGALQGNILCDVLKNNGNGNFSNNHISIGAPESDSSSGPDLGGLLGGTSAPSTTAARPAATQAAPTTQAAPATPAAPAASTTPAGTTTTPIR